MTLKVEKMKIALSQMDVKAGDPDKNLETMLRDIDSAKQYGADIIAFPEMTITGYMVGDKFTESEFIKNAMLYDEEIKEASKGIGIIYGNVHMDEVQEGFHPNKDGRERKYNAVIAVQNKEYVKRTVDCPLPRGVQPKTLLPNYRIFDDERYFFSLQDIAEDYDVELATLLQPFEFDIKGQKVKIGTQVCEDIWDNDYRKNGEAVSPTKMLIENGAEQIVNISASPWTVGKNDARDRLIARHKKELGDDFKLFAYVNNVGAQNNGKNIITFDGGSTVYGKDGKPVALANQDFKEELLLFDTDSPRDSIERIQKEPIAEKYNALIRGIQHVPDSVGAKEQPKYVIGLSGGIDSAVSAALLVEAVGTEKVFAVNMPTKYNSEATKDAAAHIAKELGIEYHVIPIGRIVDAVTDTLEECDLDGSGRKLSTLNEENIQAKIRGTDILSNLSGKYGMLFPNNGNKLEVMTGYATLYGDVGGAVGILGDLTKEEVYNMAHLVNEKSGREIIPEKLIPDTLGQFDEGKIPPMAELKENQRDPIRVVYHSALAAKMMDYKKIGPAQVVDWYREGTLAQHIGINPDVLTVEGLTDPNEFIKDLEWLTKQKEGNVFKRVQSPPIILTSKTGFGYDLRESMLPYKPTRLYNAAKAKLLEERA